MKEYLGFKDSHRDFSMGQSWNSFKEKDGFICVEKARYGLIKKDRITKMYGDNFYEITDHQLNRILNAKSRYKVIQEALKHTNQFFEE